MHNTIMGELVPVAVVLDFAFLWSLRCLEYTKHLIKGVKMKGQLLALIYKMVTKCTTK